MITSKTQSKRILRIIEILMENDIRFYFDNNLIAKHAVFTLHRPHLDTALQVFPQLISVKKHRDSSNFDVGFMRIPLTDEEGYEL